AAAAASLLSSMLVAAPAVAQEKEKCYGIATAGQNDCANLSGSHSCAGQSKVSADVNEWKYVAKGTCASMKGLTAAQAKEKVKMMTDKKS
ncbi:MAG: BufA1 family periplasmic bufferin-type metallophore, partial [Polaromonas sp.]